MVKTVIFDMDGVIYSSEPLHDRARAMLLDQYGIPKTIIDVAGKSHKDIWDPLIQEYNLPDSQPIIERKQHELVLEMVKRENVPMCDGIKEVFDELEKKRIQIALASSSAKWLVNHVLEHYDIKKRFLCILSGDDVNRKKPNPEIYLRALKICECLPQEALAIEDSDSGQTAAIEARIKCIGYRNPTSGNQKLNKGIACIDNLNEILEYI